MFPEWTGLDVVDEADGGEIHVCLSFQFNCCFMSYVGWRRGTEERAFSWHGVGVFDCWRVLSGAKDVGEEEVVI